MLGIVRRSGRAIEVPEPGDDRCLPDDAIWIDLLEPTRAEARFVERTLGIELPSREEMREIEASARVYEEGEALFLTAMLLVHVDEPPPVATELTFILKADRLVTLRFADPQPFRSMISRLERVGPGLTTAPAVLLWLVDQIIARLADVLERTALDVDQLSRRIFGAAGKKPKSEERPDLVEAISTIGRNGETASKVRESLLTLQRVVLAVGVSDRLPPISKKETRTRVKTLSRDVQSLIDHTTYLTQKINFLLDATLGIVNLEQTNIIKIFSVLAIVFLPPTMIASIYGMNFRLMPELDWTFGYPFALLLMILSAVLPYLVFKHRGWL